MPCIVCIAALAAVGFGVGVGVEEWMSKKLARVAESGSVTHETESVATWRGEFRATLDDGTVKPVRATIRIFKDSNRLSVQIEDHSLSQQEAERLEDDICDALGATISERRFPPGGPEGLVVEGSEPEYEVIAEEDLDLEVREAEAERHSPDRT